MGQEAMSRAERRAYARVRARRKPRGQYASETGRQRRQRWEQEQHMYLVQMAHKLGIGEMWDVSDRKRVVIEMNRIAARRAGVSNPTWACMNREQRMNALYAAGVTAGELVP
jgi:hypothetical protein